MAVIPYSRFETNYLSHIQQSRSPLKSLEEGTIGFPETSVRNYRHTLRTIPEERKSQFQQQVSIILIV